MEELIIYFIISGLEYAIQTAIDGAINYVVRKVVDGSGNCSTQIVYQNDIDGDGLTDTEEVAFSFDPLVPFFDGGYCLVNSGDLIGVGIPLFDIIDGTSLPDIISDHTSISGNSDRYIFDIDSDGCIDDILIPLPDFTGDGIPDWGLIVDDDDNGLPDFNPCFPFYPVGSEPYDIIVNDSHELALTKPIDNYSVSEFLLLIIAAFSCISLIGKLFKRRRYL